MPPAPRPVMDRLLAKVVIDPAGCWIFTGALDRGGYGCIGRGGKHGGMTKTHRVTFEDRFGPTELPLDHLCRVRACCNPDHLEAVTQRENVLRGEHPRISAGRTNVCPNGHPLDGEVGRRRCRTCHNAWRRTRYQLLREAGLSGREAARSC